jgi:hypothetical protein
LHCKAVAVKLAGMKRAVHPFLVSRLLAWSLRMPLAIALFGAFTVLSPRSGQGASPNFGNLDPGTAIEGVDAVNEALGDFMSGIFDREPSAAQRMHPEAKPAPSKTVQPAATKSPKDKPKSTLGKPVVAHGKAIVTVQTAVWKVLPKPWELLSRKSESSHETAKTEGR